MLFYGYITMHGQQNIKFKNEHISTAVNNNNKNNYNNNNEDNNNKL